MRYLLLSIMALVASSLSAGQTAKDAPNCPHKGNEASDSKGPCEMLDQTDRTDIFAIPLDNSEDEEKQDLDRLENMQKKIEAKKQAQQK